jgi:hypothetical protein
MQRSRMNVPAGPQQQVQVVTRLLSAKLGAEQTVFRTQLFKNETLAWAICVRIIHGRHVLGRGGHGLGCVGLHDPGTCGLVIKVLARL